jgi:CRP-like cAMP-binding protein
MRSSRTRLLPDGTPLHNRLLAALPAADYVRIQEHLQLNTVDVGHPLQDQGVPVTDVYFPNGGVFSVTNEMRDGGLVELATVGREGMLGIGAFLGDRCGTGRTFQQVADGPVPSMAVARFTRKPGWPDRFATWSRCTRKPTCRRSCSARRATPFTT